jgi:hypothetical protein
LHRCFISSCLNWKSSIIEHIRKKSFCFWVYFLNLS